MELRKQTVLIAGAAGFIGSHLCEALLDSDCRVIGVDNLISGSKLNLAQCSRHESFSFVEHDINTPLNIEGPLDVVYNLAAIASPPRYLANPIMSLTTGSVGTENLVRLSVLKGAKFIQASTSEVYGDPLVHPQSEGYFGNVNPVGPRSVYDESKRYAESLVATFYREYGMQATIVRIFNTYGPRMSPHDGRVVSNFIRQVLSDEPISVFGDGTQTRSFCYVDDCVAALLKVADLSVGLGPYNLGTPEEIPISELVNMIVKLSGVDEWEIIFSSLPVDDPARRCPDISRLRNVIKWSPTTSLEDGLTKTINYFREQIENVDLRDHG